ncbi:MAG: acyl-CoA dehydrogenase [Inquilinaceae bacterium]
MTAYTAPVDDMRFVLRHVVGLDRLTALPGYGEATADLVDAVLDEAARLAADVFAPLNTVGDRQPPRLENGVVRMPPGFREAYDQYRAGGWNALPFDPDYGGQGLPWTIALAVQEMWQSANLAFSLCPLLNQGAVELLQAHGTDDQKRTFLPKLIAGDWTGTMNLTEPQAGSDLGAIRTRAVPDGNGSGDYRIIGQKIYITFGEHDLAENIVHMVLARLPDAPAGVKGISLFLVPKYTVDADGAPGGLNDLRCVSLEHKLGIHASPTCVMAYGDNGGAVGHLIGEPHRGIEYMFTMMNNARLSVGLQGVAIAERAYQQADAYARARVQGRDVAGTADGPVAIVQHPDVRRMLLAMRARTEAARALTYAAAAALDVAKRHPDRETKAAAQRRIDLLTPVVKGWCTDLGCDVASIGIQVHGGMGYVEETGAAQHLRDARIAPIYEGTNGIQAADLVFRKVRRDGGTAMAELLNEVREAANTLERAGDDDMTVIRTHLTATIEAVESATAWLLKAEPADAAAAATPYLEMVGLAAGGHQMALSVLAVLESGSTDDPAFRDAKRGTARFFAVHCLARAPGLLPAITDGLGSVRAPVEAGA